MPPQNPLWGYLFLCVNSLNLHSCDLMMIIQCNNATTSALIVRLGGG